MDWLRLLVKLYLIPGSIRFLLLAQAIGVLLLLAGPKRAAWGRRWLVAVLGLYLALSLQGTSDLLIGALSRGYKHVQSKDVAGTRVVVVLGNGITVRAANDQYVSAPNMQSAHNALEAARVYRLMHDPVVLVSGGRSNTGGTVAESTVIADTLMTLGIPADRIAQESRSLSTLGQVDNVVEWLKKNGHGSFVVVTAPEHMRRTVGIFESRGIKPIPSISGLRYGGSPWWRPTLFGLEGSQAALYEMAAFVFYDWKGWL